MQQDSAGLIGSAHRTLRARTPADISARPNRRRRGYQSRASRDSHNLHVRSVGADMGARRDIREAASLCAGSGNPGTAGLVFQPERPRNPLLGRTHVDDRFHPVHASASPSRGGTPRFHHPDRHSRNCGQLLGSWRVGGSLASLGCPRPRRLRADGRVGALGGRQPYETHKACPLRSGNHRCAR